MRDNRKSLAVPKVRVQFYAGHGAYIALHIRVALVQADKLVFIASQAAVQRHGNEVDLYEADVAALCEMEDEEDEQAVQPEMVDDEEPHSDEEEGVFPI